MSRHDRGKARKRKKAKKANEKKPRQVRERTNGRKAEETRRSEVIRWNQNDRGLENHGGNYRKNPDADG